MQIVDLHVQLQLRLVRPRQLRPRRVRRRQLRQTAASSTARHVRRESHQGLAQQAPRTPQEAALLRQRVLAKLPLATIVGPDQDQNQDPGWPLPVPVPEVGRLKLLLSVLVRANRPRVLVQVLVQLRLRLPRVLEDSDLVTPSPGWDDKSQFDIPGDAFSLNCIELFLWYKIFPLIIKANAGFSAPLPSYSSVPKFLYCT